jgi:hypothetical protein
MGFVGKRGAGQEGLRACISFCSGLNIAMDFDLLLNKEGHSKGHQMFSS